ncbi:hypothetical protein DEU56DRAFT_828942 [Suillus clintonianus]|uniref:uncharacterized protein n=1 Tax=Suillus clintonianus TaxID=1904413 RepID=UPI001B882AE6|nr:uncharacterized protein DEU56DRAFT_828942 [Suillus clintonianus]KAG2123829.1 hypothetical protein DEU56DRAFT_828942 [Suillus clintonianus]
MNFLTIILLAFTAVSPLSARAMPGPETTDKTCTWRPCGALPCPIITLIGAIRPCYSNGVETTQYCCNNDEVGPL